MRADQIQITPAEYERVLSKYTDPTRGKIAKLAAVLHDDVLARELSRRWLEEQIMKSLGKGQTLTPTLMTLIAHRLSRETIMRDVLGVPVRQTRAGDRFETALAVERARGRRLTRPEREALWDDVVLAEMDRQARECKSRSWWPLHDGRTARPHAKDPNPNLGLAAWERLHDLAPRMRGFGPLDGDGVPDEDKDMALADMGRGGGAGFQVTAAWLADHGVTLDRLAALTPEELESMGVDASSAREVVAAGLEPVRAVDALALVLDDMPLARALHEARPHDSAVAVLAALGMGERYARTGVRFESLARDGSDPALRQRLWDAACRMMRPANRDAAGGAAGLREYGLRVRRARERAVRLVASAL